jgi:hypothetical protein
MRAASPEPLQLVRFPRRPVTTGRRLHLAAVAAVGVATFAALAWLSSGRSTLRDVAPEQRAALLSSTLDELRQFCGKGHASALDDHCRELATFAARFDECRAGCEALVRPFVTPNPTR